MRQVLNTNSERIPSQVFAKLANLFSCLLDNASLHLSGCVPCALILLSNSIAFLLKSLYRTELRAIQKNSPTLAE